MNTCGREAKFKAYLELSDDLLCSMIPPFSPGYENIYLSPEGQVRAGKRLYRTLVPALREEICGKCRLQDRYLEINQLDSVAQVKIVERALTTSMQRPLSIVLAILVTRTGLEYFCGAKRDL